MIYDVICQGFQHELITQNSIVYSFLTLEDAKVAAENLAVAHNKEVFISLRIVSYLPKAVWNPQK